MCFFDTIKFECTMRFIIVTILLIFTYSCSEKQLTLQNWDASFYDQELINNAFAIADKNFTEGKRFTDSEKLAYADDEFKRLVDTYSHEKSKQKLKELKEFKSNYYNYYKGMIKRIEKKGYIFTTAGYYKKILNLFPQSQEAKEYLNQHSNSIKQRLNRNIELGFNFIKKRKFTSAKRCFNRVLVFSPKSTEAKRGLNEIERRRKLKRYKRAKPKTNKNITIETVSKQLLETIPKMTEDEKNNLYNLGIKAFESRDYLKAYEFFESIDDPSYRETTLYLSRTDDKLNESGDDDTE